jgi:hypothetical protein
MTPDRCAELLDSIPEFEGLFDRKTTEQVESMLDAFVNSTVTDPESASTETTRYGKTTDSGTTDTTTDTTNAVDAAFAELGSL